MFATLPIGPWVMSLTLSSHEQALLGNALAVTAAPLAYATTRAWRAAMRCAIELLLGADLSMTTLALAGEPDVESPAEDALAWDAYVKELLAENGESRCHRFSGPEVANMEMINHLGSHRRQRLYNEFARPHGFLDAVGITLEVGGLPAPLSVNFYHASEHTAPFDQRAVALLTLLVPVLRASVETLARLGPKPRGAALTGLIDALPDPAALCGATGRVVHESPALRRLLAAEPLAPQVRQALGAIGRSLAALVVHSRAKLSRAADRDTPAVVVVRGARGRYEIRGSLLESGREDGAKVAAVVLVRAAPPRAPSDAELRARFALTTRELQVVRHLAAGRSAREVAAALGVSYYTARHHVEHVLAKLGVHSRAAVASVLTAGNE